MSTLDVRLALLRNSYLPIPAKGKAPHINGWSTKTATNEAERSGAIFAQQRLASK